MGCAASNLDNEDTVRRCKERYSLLKEAVYVRHLLAAAHADYCCSLWVMGSALSSFAAGEALSVPDETPHVLLRPPNSHPSHAHPVPPRLPPSPSPSLHSPPPPPHFASSPSHKDLKENVRTIKENFDKGAAAGDQVEMLEMGSALSSFASGEPLSVSDRTPAVLVHPPNSHSSDVHRVPPSLWPSLHLPPSPAPHFAPSTSRKDLKVIVDVIRENFHKAAAAGNWVSEMLEIGKPEFDWSFWQLKKTVHHSSSVLSNFSSCWTSKLPLAMKYRPDTAVRDEQDGPKSLCSTLYQLLAWERNLYEEMKARKGAKIDHDKKLSALRSQEDYGGDKTKLDKSKASIKRLHSLTIVRSQCVSSTSTSIIGLRDRDLVPQLEELCHGFVDMWRSMHQYHEVQNQIVQQVGVNRSGKGDPTSELHRLATRELESAVSSWHSSFCRLIKFQSDFIRSIHDWFELTLISLTNDNVDGNEQPTTVPDFINKWKLAFDQGPDTVASETIKNFIKDVHDIYVKQTEELSIKKRTETLKKFKKKASAVPSIDAQDPLADKKSELAACQRRMQAEMRRHSKAVEVTRAVTLNNLRTGLSCVFQELISVSVSFTEALDRVCIDEVCSYNPGEISA